MKISIADYKSPDLFKSLCEEIDLPTEITNRLLNHIGATDPSLIDPRFEELFSLETGQNAVKEIPELCKTGDDETGDSGLKALAIYVAAALRTREIYKKSGISNEIYLDTIKVFRRFLYEHLATFGHFGFDRHFWIYRQISANLFRLGVLEFEIKTLRPDSESFGPAGPGDPVLGVHIPSDAIMTRAGLDASYRMAKDFFARYFPDFRYKCICCSSWLLSPVLATILKPGSRILDFQSDYDIIDTDPDSNGGMIWLYKKRYDDPNDLPEDTSLMRAMKKHLISGGKIGSGRGILRLPRVSFFNPAHFI